MFVAQIYCVCEIHYWLSRVTQELIKIHFKIRRLTYWASLPLANKTLDYVDVPLVVLQPVVQSVCTHYYIVDSTLMQSRI